MSQASPEPPSGPVGGYGADLPPGVSAPESSLWRRTDPLALISLVLGASTWVSGACCFPAAGLGVIVGVVGVALGVVSLSRIAAHPQMYEGRAVAITGICVSVLGPIATFTMLYLLFRVH